MRAIAFLAAFVAGLAPAASAAITASAPASAMASLTVQPPAASTDYNLPQLGIAGGAAFPPWKSAAIGRLMYYELQQEGVVLNDPLVAGYIDYLGHRLSSVSGDTQDTFHYFPLLDPEINSFAAPGGFVAIFTGLITATRNEDELAGVMAHETAHEAQHHINREVADSSYNSLVDLAMLIGAIAVAAANPDLAVGALMGAQGGVIQREINYTRADEYEADRVGIAILARAGFNPDGMVEFFEYAQQQYAMNGYQIPQFLADHPLPLARISEAENRAKNLHVVPQPEDPNYALMKARIRVLTSDNLDETLHHFREEAKHDHNDWYRQAAVYGMVLCLTRLNEGARALELIKPLAEAHSDNIALQLGLAEALLAAGHTEDGLAALAQDNTLYPSNIAVAMAYARALLDAGNAKQAIAVLTPVAPLIDAASPIYNPDLYQLLASAANQAGDQGLTYLAQANYLVGQGEFKAAIVQVRLGLEVPDLPPMQREQMETLRKQVEAQRKQAKQLGAPT